MNAPETQGPRQIPSQAAEPETATTAPGTAQAAGSPAAEEPAAVGEATAAAETARTAPSAEHAAQPAPDVEPVSPVAGAARQPDAAGDTAAALAGEAEPETATAVDTEEAEEAPEGMTEAEPAAPPGRPHKSLLAGAAIVGALLMTVPFLVGRDGENPRAAPAGAAPGTVLGSPGDGSLPVGAVGSASPTPGGTAGTGGPAGESPTPDGPAAPGASADTGAVPFLNGADGTPAGPVEREGDGSSAPEKKAPAAPTPAAPAPAKASPAANTAPQSLTQVAGVPVRSHASGRCIDVTGGKGDGTPLQIWDCNRQAQQSWRFMNDGTVRALGLCMDVAWGATGNGAVIQLATCSGNPAQQFRLNSATHDLVSLHANKCVDVKDRQTGNGTRLQLWDCNGRDNQKWSAG
ncbi:ricin-type beta-trefoil lectin domain protein [Streptomyces sp. NPDC056224]|uniref:ricin-type beta-trefoil lectin domain protein n=1 Tax=Streptomyces sp. NPDC056224 TaxID=3345750 RepID=UPI0035DC58C1